MFYLLFGEVGIFPSRATNYQKNWPRFSVLDAVSRAPRPSSSLHGKNEAGSSENQNDATSAGVEVGCNVVCRGKMQKWNGSRELKQCPLSDICIGNNAKAQNDEVITFHFVRKF